MKRIFTLIICLALVLGLAACGNSNSSETAEPASTSAAEVTEEETEAATEVSETEESTVSETESAASSEETEEPAGKTLIAYFSHTGNTEEIAQEINALVGGDLVEIVEADPYPSAYQECVDRAEQEKDQDARPETTTIIENMEDYDTVYIGYPIWWHDTPMIIYTFLESYDFSGKTIIPFCTSGGSDIDESMPTINSLCAEATILEGLTANGPEDVEGWLSEIGMLN